MASNPHVKDDASVAADEKCSDFTPLTLEQRSQGLGLAIEKFRREGTPVVVKVWSSRDRRYYRLGRETSRFDSSDQVIRQLEKLHVRGVV